jgi:hypothetical protein
VIATSWSIKSSTEEAVQEAANSLKEKLNGAKASLIILWSTEFHVPSVLSKEMRKAFPEANIHGLSSCGGVFTEQGFHHVGTSGIEFITCIPLSILLLTDLIARRIWKRTSFVCILHFRS